MPDIFEASVAYHFTQDPPEAGDTVLINNEPKKVKCAVGPPVIENGHRVQIVILVDSEMPEVDKHARLFCDASYYTDTALTWRFTGLPNGSRVKVPVCILRANVDRGGGFAMLKGDRVIRCIDGSCFGTNYFGGFCLRCFLRRLFN